MTEQDVLSAVYTKMRDIYDNPIKDPRLAPFYDFILSIPIKYDSDPKMVAATDGSFFYFGERFLELTSMEQWFVMFHETMHVWLHHPKRGMDKVWSDPWNYATDFMINGILANMGYIPPVGCAYNPKEVNVKIDTSEIVYARLIADLPANPPSLPGKGKKGGEGGEEQEGKGEGTSNKYAPKDKLTGKELKNPLAGDLKPYNPINENIVREAIERATQKAQKLAEAGNAILPPHMLEGLLPRVERSVDWRSVLEEYVSRYSSHRQYTWSQPSKKTMGIGVYTPKYKRVKESTGVIALDESGSVTADEDLLNAFLGEIDSIFDSDVMDGHMLNFSERIDYEWEIPPTPTIDEVMHKLTSGGTNFHTVMRYIEEEYQNDIDFLIMFTDLGADFPPMPPYPVIWVTKTKDRKVPYGDVIMLN